MAIDKTKLTGVEKVYPLNVSPYEQYMGDFQNPSVVSKINAMIQSLHQIGRLTNETVSQWNNVMRWIIGGGMEEIAETVTNERVSVALDEVMRMLDVSLNDGLKVLAENVSDKKIDELLESGQFESMIQSSLVGINEVVENKLDGFNQQLSTTEVIITDTNKTITGIENRIPIISTPLKTLEKFEDDLFNFEYTSGIKVVQGSVADTKQLTIEPTSYPNSANVAVYDSMNNVRGYEVTIDPATDISKMRLGFANSVKDFTFINFASGEYYLINGGVPTASINNPLTPITFATGDRVKLVSHNMTIQVFKNGALVGLVKPQLSYATRRLEDKGKNYPAISFRSGEVADVYGVNKLKVYQKSYPKFMHFSYDDEIELLQRLTTTTPASIFELDTFAFMKDMHDKYGAVFTVNLFYKYSDTFTLANVTSDYLSEFRSNSHWLKFGFHGLDGVVNYNTLDVATAKLHYENTVNEIARFASSQCVDTMPRASMFTGNLENVRAWRDVPKYGLTGLLAADDTRQSYYHSVMQKDALIVCDDFYDETEKLFFMRTDLRIDSATNVYQTLESRKNDFVYDGQQNAKIIFWHASWTLSEQKKLNIEESCKWARDNGYVFLFPMDVNPKF